MVVFVLLCEHILPLALIRRHPDRVLELLLPSFEMVVRVLTPITSALIRLGVKRRERSQPTTSRDEPEETIEQEPEPTPADHDHLQEGQARELLRSLVEFRETMVREVMTPRPDIVAIAAQATLGELHTLVREQQYSRIPVFRETLDNIVGFISIKDLILLTNCGTVAIDHAAGPSGLLRAGDKTRARAVEGVSTQARADGDCRGRIRWHFRAGYARRPARRNRRRNQRRVRCRNRAGAGRGRRALCLQRPAPTSASWRSG